MPADHKWVARTAVAVVVDHAIHSLDLSYPKPTQEQLEAIERARAELERE